jgi:hypothetical protein
MVVAFPFCWFGIRLVAPGEPESFYGAVKDDLFISGIAVTL